MNVVARLLLRTRGYASFFFIIAVATVFYLNVNRQAGRSLEETRRDAAVAQQRGHSRLDS